MTNSEVRLILTTLPDRASAEKMSARLIEQKTAACVQIQEGLTSFFPWKGKMSAESECIVLIKTLDSHLLSVEAEFTQLHPYETPEFLVFEASGVSQKYLAWMKTELESIKP